MRVIPAKVHGLLDYSVSLLMLVTPWVFGFAGGGAETWVLVLAGSAGIVYSALTAYELGVVPIIPMPLHLMLDLGLGLVLLLSPWLFGFADVVYLPHVVLGAFAVLAAALTRPRPTADLAR